MSAVGASDPVFVIGDLSTVWLTAFVRETEAPMVRSVSRSISPSWPIRIGSFPAKISYVATAIDPATRRLLVRASVDNADGLLKPEMFASVTILTGEGETAIAVPRDAMIHEGERARGLGRARPRYRDRTAPDQDRPDQWHAWSRCWTVLPPSDRS